MREEGEYLPRLSVKLGRVISPLYRLFDRLYGSRYNPLYRSGTLAAGMLVVLLVTGVYLLLYYSVSRPYESLEGIQGQVFFGRWIRALHRYATDVMIVATVFHILQLLVQGKTWGPRALPWVSGLFLLVLIYMSAWTGFVMVWDEHGQLLAMAGARMLATIGIFREPLARAFDGSAPVTASFFFMNLFLHVAIPVGIFFALWVHTAKLSRARWFPRGPIFITALVALFLLSLVRPAPFLAPGDLLHVVGRIPVDSFVGFWLPFAEISPLGTLIAAVFFSLLLASLPLWWRSPDEAVSRRGSSVVYVERCTGCTQCAQDCPYEAISMQPREDGRRLIAVVSHSSCVSCGICAASCGDMAIGPPGRSGADELERIEQLLRGVLEQPKPSYIACFVCQHNGKSLAAWNRYAEANPELYVIPQDCCGTVHTQSIEKVLERVQGVFLHACPEANCFNRDGLDLATQRIWFKRLPFLDRKVDRRRLRISAASDAEFPHVFAELAAFQTVLRDLLPSGDPDVGTNAARQPHEERLPKNLSSAFPTAVTTALLCALISLGSSVPLGATPTYGILRVAARLPSASTEECRPLTDAERASRPLHMQTPEVCSTRPLRYLLEMTVDGETVREMHAEPAHVFGDGPLMIHSETGLTPGSHDVTLRLEGSGGASTTYSFAGTLEVKPGRVYLFIPSPTMSSSFELLQSPFDARQ